MKVQGLNNSDTAGCQVLSHSMDKFHVRSILPILETVSRTEAVVLALQNNLVM